MKSGYLSGSFEKVQTEENISYKVHESQTNNSDKGNINISKFLYKIFSLIFF